MAKRPYFNKSIVHWGIIGCGNVTEVKSGPPYQTTPNFALHTVMRRNATKLKDYALRHKVPNFTTNAANLINNASIDAVYIATPPDTHKYYALQVAQAGKVCCVEKPFGVNYQDSLAIYQAFKDQSIPLFVAYYRRTLPRFLQIKQWLQENAIGTPRHIHWVKTRTTSPVDVARANNWRTNAKVAPAGYFNDLASHGLDLFTFLLGDVKRATGIAQNQQGYYTALDAVSASWEHQNGVLGTATFNFGSYKAVDEVFIMGTQGEIKFSVLHEAPVELITNTAKQSLQIAHPKHLHQYHVLAMQKHILHGVTHPSTGKTALHTSWVMQQILEKS